MFDSNNVARTAMAQAFSKTQARKDAELKAQRGMPADLLPGESMASWALRKQHESAAKKPTTR